MFRSSYALAVSLTLLFAMPACARAADVEAYWPGEGLTVTAPRIAMDFSKGANPDEPSYPPGDWKYGRANVTAQPVMYRTVWTFDASPTVAPVRIAADELAYVWVNGRCVLERGKGEAPIELDLGPYLQAGKNVIAVSTSKAGLALAGVAIVDGKAIELASDPATWINWKFPSLTIFEDSPFVTQPSREDLQWANVKAGAGEGISMSAEQARAIVRNSLTARMEKMLGDIDYRTELLNKRGIVIYNERPMVWGGAYALPEVVVTASEGVRQDLSAARDAAAAAQSDPANAESLIAAWDTVAALEARMAAIERYTAAWRRVEYVKLAAAGVVDFEPMSGLAEAAAAITAKDDQTAMAELAGLEMQLDRVEETIVEQTGAAINELDSAIANKCGWIDDPTLVDSVPAAWGVRFNPMEISWFIDLAGKWRFKLDPDNDGLEQRVHEFGYNIANQWPELNVPGYWEKQGNEFQANNPKANAQTPCPGVNVRTDGPYNGWAWYRKKVLVPAAWAGYDLELYMEAVDDFDWFYWNGEELAHTDANTNPDDFWKVERHYTIPKEKVTFGGYNVIAIRVYDCGAGGGIKGGIELRCPALEASYKAKADQAQKKRKPTSVYSGALSPVAILTAGEAELEMFGWDFRGSAGPEGMVLNTDRDRGPTHYFPFEESGVIYDAARDGKLTKNWALLWAKPGRADGEMPIQLVFLNPPKSISIERVDLGNDRMGTKKVTIAFENPGETVLALRPIRGEWAKGISEAYDPSVLETCDYWSQVALAYPMHYAEIAKVDPADAYTLQVENRYEYRRFEDAWGTEPITLAPLPPLASYGLSVDARGVSAEAQPKKFDLGEYGTLHAAEGPSIAYTSPIDRLPRFGGFTDFCFGPDVGVPGNHAEIDIIAWTGANCWRPQSNDNDVIMKSVKWANEAGLSLIFNIDNKLGAKPEAIDHWVKIARQCKDLPEWAVAYDLINEPANMPPDVYNPQIQRITEALREVDTTHVTYIETPHSFASIDQFVNLQPVDDPKAAYCFHDYDYRLKPRWPTLDTDIRNMQHQFLPAFKYGLEHDAPIVISEYGGFHQTDYDPWSNPAALTLLADFFKVFDQFGMHHQYYSNRGEAKVRDDGSLQPSMVHMAFRRLFDGDTFYRFRENWHAKVTEQLSR